MHYIFTAFYLATILIASLAAGRIVSHLKIPKVTGYLFAGVLLGPSAAGLISGSLSQKIHSSVGDLFFLSDIALGLIAFSIGGEFENERFKKMGKQIITISLWETLITFCFVALSILAFTKNYRLSLLLGILAIATAPAATLLVLREYDSEGPVTNSILILTGLNNFICLSIFTLFFPMLGIKSHTTSFYAHIITLFTSLGTFLLSIFLGIILGFLLSLFEKKFPKTNELILLLVAIIILAVSSAKMIGVSPLIVNLVLGATAVNISKRGKTLFEEIKKIDLFVYVSFFAMAGASLHWELIGKIGFIGTIYIGGRICGKVIGIRWGAFKTKSSHNLKKYGGFGLLAQAGVVLGLAFLVQQQNPELGRMITTTILSTVIFFEIFGPIAVRFAIVNSGEVKIIKFIHRDEGLPFIDYLREIFSRLLFALGIPAWKKKKFTGEILVEHIMRTHGEIIKEDTHFDQILKTIEHSRYNLFPVVNQTGQYIGMLSFQEIRDVLYDDIMKDLIIAKDIINKHVPTIHSQASVNDALDIFSRENVDILPVVDDKSSNHLLGILTQRDVLTVFQNKQKL